MAELETKEQETDELVDLSGLVLPLFERWKLILLLTLIGAAVAFGISRMIPKTYVAKALVYPKQSDTTSQLLRGLPILVGGSDRSYSGYILTLLQSETLLGSVADKLHLNTRRDFTFGKSLKPEEVLERLRKQITVVENKNGSIQIAVKAANPYLAAAIANSMLDRLDKMVVRTSRRKVDFISQKLEETTRDLQKAEDEMLAFQERYDVAAIEEQTTGLIDQLTELDGRLLVIDVELEEVRSRLANAGELNSLIDDQVRQKALEASRNRIVEARSRLQEKMLTLPSVAVKYGRLKRRIAVLSKTFELLTEQYQLARITQQGEDGDYQIIDRARPKTKKVAPRTLVNTVAGGFLGGLLGAVIATWSQAARSRRKSRRMSIAE